MSGQPPANAELSGVLQAVSRYVRRYVVLSAEQTAAITLWIAHTHAFGAAETTPYLAITSAEKRSGKTRLLEVLAVLVARPWLTGRVTAAVLPRKIAAETPTLLLDESDAAFASGQEYAEALRGTLNTGYRRGGQATVCVGKGAAIGFADFATFCPKAIAGIGNLPDTVADRSIPIRLTRRTAAEPVERYRRRHAEPLATELRETLAAAVGDAIDLLEDALPELPEELSDRAADVWEPLLAIADMAGGSWPQIGRMAAVLLSGTADVDADSIAVRLLADVRDVFNANPVERVPTGELLDALHGIEDAPWPDWSKGRPITARKLADILRRHGIRPGHWRAGADTVRGYRRADFEDAWTRHLPLSPDLSRHTRHNPLSKPKTGDSDSARDSDACRIENGQIPHNQAVVPVVPDQTGDTGAEHEFLAATEALVATGQAEWITRPEMEP